MKIEHGDTHETPIILGKRHSNMPDVTNKTLKNRKVKDTYL